MLPGGEGAHHGGLFHHAGTVPKRDVENDIRIALERKRLADSVREKLAQVDFQFGQSHPVDISAGNFIQRMLKTGALTGKVVEYRRRGQASMEFNRGIVMDDGSIKCRCHGSNITLTEFEAHSGSQLHRPAEFIHLKSVDLSLRDFGRLVTGDAADLNLNYCLSCHDGGDLLCCEVCPGSFHAQCAGLDHMPASEEAFLCQDCTTTLGPAAVEQAKRRGPGRPRKHLVPSIPFPHPYSNISPPNNNGGGGGGRSGARAAGSGSGGKRGGGRGGGGPGSRGGVVRRPSATPTRQHCGADGYDDEDDGYGDGYGELEDADRCALVEQAVAAVTSIVTHVPHMTDMSELKKFTLTTCAELITILNELV